MAGVATHGNSTQLDKCGDNHVLRTKWGAPLFVPISRMPDKVILTGAVRQITQYRYDVKRILPPEASIDVQSACSGSGRAQIIRGRYARDYDVPGVVTRSRLVVVARHSG
jgi:hypothetical protein